MSTRPVTSTVVLSCGRKSSEGPRPGAEAFHEEVEEAVEIDTSD